MLAFCQLERYHATAMLTTLPKNNKYSFSVISNYSWFFNANTIMLLTVNDKKYHLNSLRYLF